MSEPRTRRARRAQRTPADELRRLTRRRRRRVLLGSAVLWLPLFMVGCDLSITPGLAATAIEEYHAGELAEAVDGFETLEGVNLVERWKAPFDLGTALVRQGEDAVGAVTMLNQALELVPEEHYCTVRRNQAIALEVLGDDELARSEELAAWAVEAREYEEAGEEPPDDVPWSAWTVEELEEDAVLWAGWAAGSYASARDARTDPACPPPSSPEEQEQEEEALDRLDDKQDRADGAAGVEPEPQPETAEEREEALAERNAEAGAQAEAERQRRAAEEARSEDAGGGGGSDGGGSDDGEGQGTGGGTRGW